eukprot:scaffold13648_cov38-Phaeocystis_antarctica.AAC.3
MTPSDPLSTASHWALRVARPRAKQACLSGSVRVGAGSKARRRQDGALGLGGGHQRAGWTIAGRDGSESSTRSVASTAATVVYRAIDPNSSTTRWTSCGRCEKRQGRVASTGVPGVSNGRLGSRWPSARLTTLPEH